MPPLSAPFHRQESAMHNENFVPIDRWWRAYVGDTDSDAVQRGVMKGIRDPDLTLSTRAWLQDIMNSKDKVRFKSLSFKNPKTRLCFMDKIEFSKRCTQRLYFRKMSLAEFADLEANHKDKPLNAALKFKNTDLYRVWVSSSEAMCLKFHNDAATSASDVIVKFVLSGEPILDLKCAPHQQTGVQHDKNAIAVHRETFAHIENFDAADLTDVKARQLDHNLGFTLTSVKAFHDVFTRYVKIT
jgi:hypothetical protein